MWPVGLLLDRRLDDKSSRNFRRYWYICTSLAVGFMCLMLCWLFMQLWADIQDFRNGQLSELAAVVVEGLHALNILYVGIVFVNKALWAPASGGH